MTRQEPKLIPAPEAAPEQPQFPITNLQIVQQGLLVTMVLAQNISINCLIGEEAMNEVCKKWVENRKQVADQLRVIREVNRTKTN